MNVHAWLRLYIYGTLCVVLALTVPIFLWIGLVDIPYIEEEADIYREEIEPIMAEVAILPTPITILHVGDVMLDRHVAVLIERHGIDWIFAPLVSSSPDFFSAPDITMLNLEGPFAERRIDTTKSIAFRFDPLYAAYLADIGVDLVSLANNHAQDMGRAAFEETKVHLNAVGIRYVGEQYAVNSSSLHYETVASTTIAFIAINDTHPGTNIDRAIELITYAETVADLTIITIHWGAEYQLVSNERQRTLARKFVDAGADAVIGHHPHVVQEIEIYNGVPIAYSLGNFVFDQYFSVDTQQGIGVRLTILDDTVQGLELIPLHMIRTQVYQMEGEMKEQFLESLIARSRIDGYTVTSTQILFP
jgi:poly-gamma-glutamate synthesis protein (capsule biosynthesis protein)